MPSAYDLQCLNWAVLPCSLRRAPSVAPQTLFAPALGHAPEGRARKAQRFGPDPTGSTRCEFPCPWTRMMDFAPTSLLDRTLRQRLAHRASLLAAYEWSPLLRCVGITHWHLRSWRAVSVRKPSFRRRLCFESGRYSREQTLTGFTLARNYELTRKFRFPSDFISSGQTLTRKTN